MTSQPRKLRFVFAVQGDGRGHLTQALALQRIVRDAGHELAAFLVGCADPSALPAFFREGAEAPVLAYASLEFATDPANRSVQPLHSVTHNLKRVPQYRRSLSAVDEVLRRERPDLLVNLFEPAATLGRYWHCPRLPMVCVAHQYLLLHPGFAFPPGHRADRLGLKQYVRLTALGAARKLALAFDQTLPNHPAARLTVVPPLLRPDLFAQPLDVHEDFLLLYLLKAGLRDDVIAWHQGHPDVPLHCFSDAPQPADAVPFDATLTFHRLSADKFLAMMARCRGLVCTGGFESVCEAMYLGKPALMVPVAGHFEQACNARDGERAGAGIGSPTFDFDRFLAYLPTHRTDSAPFRHWVRSAPERFLRLFEEIAAGD